MEENNQYEVIIIGGSYAGLSSAMALGRSLRKVLIIDNAKPCNIQTPYSHNFLTQDGKTPSEISAIARQQVEKYHTVKFFSGLAIGAIKSGNDFEVITSTEEKFIAKKIILATGIKDILPNIKGFSDCWGISVIHCPYCHGFEFRHKSTGILANGPRALHLASLVRNLTENVTILTNGKADFDEDQIAKIKRNNIEIIETPFLAVEHQDGQITNAMFDGDSSKSFDALYASLPFTQHSEISKSLGCELTEQGYIKVSPMQETSIPGVFACGDNSNMMRSIANAVYTGNLAGAVVNSKLVEEKF